jgi:resuscitation-promoting factor RpfB
MPSTGTTYAAVALGGLGSVIIYSAVKGKGWTSSLRDVIAGNSPASGPDTNAITSGSGDTESGGDDNSGSSGDTGAATKSAAKNQAVAKLLCASYGWSTGNQWECLLKLWNKESSWDNTADNATSGAYGIAQALPSSKYPLAGRPPSEGGSASPRAQISWGLSYIKGRYGSPCQAWAHETADNWY